MNFEVTKKYHFYSAHRNEYLEGSKCVNPHGHTYKIAFTFRFDTDMVDETGVTIPFEGFDNAIEPMIKALDHAFIINRSDEVLLKFFDSQGFKLIIIDGAASVENLCLHINKLFEKEHPELHSALIRISIRETESSEVVLNLK